MASKTLYTTKGMDRGIVNAGQGVTFERLEDGTVKHKWLGGERVYSRETWDAICAGTSAQSQVEGTVLHNATEATK